MQTLALFWGIVAMGNMIVGFFPCLGWLNWFNIPFSGIGVILSAVALGSATRETKGQAIGGLICCIVALFFGIIRLVAGAGVV